VTPADFEIALACPAPETRRGHAARKSRSDDDHIVGHFVFFAVGGLFFLALPWVPLAHRG
jgi:hypothetical protein